MIHGGAPATAGAHALALCQAHGDAVRLVKHMLVLRAARSGGAAVKDRAARKSGCLVGCHRPAFRPATHRESAQMLTQSQIGTLFSEQLVPDVHGLFRTDRAGAREVAHRLRRAAAATAEKAQALADAERAREATKVEVRSKHRWQPPRDPLTAPRRRWGVK